MFNRLSFLVTLILTSSIAYANTKIPVTVYGDDGYQPYSFIEGMEQKGIYTEILRKAFSQLKDFDVTIELVPWPRGLGLIKTGDGFALFPPYYRPRERPFIGQYSMPILNEQTALYCAKDKLPKGGQSVWPVDYYNLSIGINRGFLTLDMNALTAEQKQKIFIEESENMSVNLKKLQAGHIDCYVNDIVSILYTMDKLNIDKSKFIIGSIVSDEQGFVGYTAENENFPYQKDFAQKLDSILKNMQETGEIQAIINQYTQ